MKTQISRLKSSHLLSAVLVSLAQLPANAQTTIQSGTQESNITGNNNQVYQTIDQTIYNYPDRRWNDRRRDRRSRHRLANPANPDEMNRRRERRERRDDDDDD
jgi:hypothetical protein